MSVIVVGTVTKTDVVLDRVRRDSVVRVMRFSLHRVLVVVSTSVIVVGCSSVSVITVSTGWVMMIGSVMVTKEATVWTEVRVFNIFFHLFSVVTLTDVTVSVAVKVTGEVVVQRLVRVVVSDTVIRLLSVVLR